MVSDTDIGALAKRVAELERRLDRMEKAGMRRTVSPEGCAACGGAMFLTDEKPHPLMGIVGLKVRTLTCDSCGKTVERDYDPAKG